MSSPPVLDETDWVPLTNTFSKNLSSREDEDFQFSVTRGSSDILLQVQFRGGADMESDVVELAEEISFDKLLTLHQQMTELYPDEVTFDLPSLPTVPTGLWSYLLSVTIRPGFYEEIAGYLCTLCELCSVGNVLAVFFADATTTPVSYEEQWNEVNRKRYQDEMELCQAEWDQILQTRAASQFRSIAELNSYYDSEDIAEYDLLKAEEKLHHFQTQPFRDLCEIASKRRDEAHVRAKNAELAVSEQMSALQKERAFHVQFLEATESLHELSIDRLHSQAERIEGILTRLSDDESFVGKSWNSQARQRKDRIENKLNRVIVELLRTQCQRVANQKDRALLDMALVEEGPSMEVEVRKKEDDVYRIQLRLLEIQLRLLEEEERKLRLEERYTEGAESEGVARRLEHLPSKMSKLRLKMKEEVLKKEEEKRRLAMKDQRQKTIERVKHYIEKNPTPVKKLPLRYQPPSQRKQNIKKKANKKAAPIIIPPSRLSGVAKLTKSAYTKSKPLPTASVKVKRSTPPPVPPMPSDLQAIANTLKDLPPPPPPPPSQHPPPPPPPPPPAAPQLPVAKAMLKQASASKISKSSSNKSEKPTNMGSSAINLNTILNARQKLKPSAFGRALESGVVTDTSAEVACLIRSGAGAENSSLTKDAASFLRKRFEHIKTVTSQSDSEDSEDDHDWT